MRRLGFRLLILALTAMGLAGCSRDPNVRKQKYLESGERYLPKLNIRPQPFSSATPFS